MISSTPKTESQVYIYIIEDESQKYINCRQLNNLIYACHVNITDSRRYTNREMESDNITYLVSTE